MKILTMIILGVTLMFGAVDINTASQQELSTLNGVGKVKSSAIIEYRNSKCFGSVDELSNVKGIGKKTVLKNKDNLTVSECKVK